MRRRDPNAPVDTIKPLTIKAVPTTTQDAIATAAPKEGLTQGQWLERRVNEWLAAGSPVPVSMDEVFARVDAVAKLADATAKLALLPDTAEVRRARAVVHATIRAVRPPTRKRLAGPSVVPALAGE